MLGGLLFLGYLAIILAFHELRLTLFISWRRDRRRLAEEFIHIQARRLLRAARLLAGLQVEVEPYEALPESFVLVTNHQSLADIPVLINAFDRQHLKIVAKHENIRALPSISKSLRYSRQASVDRSGPFRASLLALRQLAQRLDEGACAVIFPEGTRSRSGFVGRFHSAGFRVLTGDGKAPVVFAALDGGWRMSGLATLLAMGRHPYRVKTLKVAPPPRGKAATLALLDQGRALIVEQLSRWREPSGDEID